MQAVNRPEATHLAMRVCWGKTARPSTGVLCIPCYGVIAQMKRVCGVFQALRHLPHHKASLRVAESDPSSIHAGSSCCLCC